MSNTTYEASHKDMANAIRALSMDAVQAANSVHPGMPMGDGRCGNRPVYKIHEI